MLRDGYSSHRAILDGAVTRLRPILMTALMAGLGLLPAALSRDIGSETNRPFACVIVGGILTGTIFMLLVLPAALKLFGNFSRRSLPKLAPSTSKANFAPDELLCGNAATLPSRFNSSPSNSVARILCKRFSAYRAFHANPIANSKPMIAIFLINVD